MSGEKAELVFFVFLIHNTHTTLMLYSSRLYFVHVSVNRAVYGIHNAIYSTYFTRTVWVHHKKTYFEMRLLEGGGCDIPNLWYFF